MMATVVVRCVSAPSDNGQTVKAMDPAMLHVAAKICEEAPDVHLPLLVSIDSIIIMVSF